jgi:hypothetical protein
VLLFVAGWSDLGPVDAGRGRAAVAQVVDALPFFPGRAVEEWEAPSGTAALAWVAHAPELVGGVRYVRAGDGGFALFAGRPVEWPAGGEADGQKPLDPGFYSRPAGDWMERLDGRCGAARYDEATRTLEVRADPLGAYPLYVAEAGGASWVSNSPAALRALAGDRRVDLDALAGLLAGGWPLGGRSMWAAVRRVERGTLVRLAPGREAPGAAVAQLLPASELASLWGRGFDPAEAADALVASVRALADWPGRPSLVPVTGGRDSRLVLAAARAAGIDFEAATGGAPESPDVVAAAALCAAAGVPHRRLEADPHGDVFSRPAEMARVLGLLTGGTSSLADAAGFPLGPREGPLPLWHSGQGGEVARAYYRAAGPGWRARLRPGGARAALVDGLERLFCGRRPGRAEPLSDAARRRVRAGIERFVAGQLAAGAEPVDVPDLFYLLERMGSWAGPTHGAVEPVRDTTSPLWSARLLPFELGPSAAARRREELHRAVLRELAPELLEVPFAGGAGWGTPPRIARARRLAARAAAEARRATARRRPGGGPSVGVDPFGAILDQVRAAAAARPDHVAWRVLDRGRVERLLARDPAALDTMSRYYVWRIATVLLDPGLDGAEPAG